MILKIQRPLYPLNAPFTVCDQTGSVLRSIKDYKVPYKVQQSCRFGKAYWTAIIRDGEIEFVQQLGPQSW